MHVVQNAIKVVIYRQDIDFVVTLPGVVFVAVCTHIMVKWLAHWITNHEVLGSNPAVAYIYNRK